MENNYRPVEHINDFLTTSKMHINFYWLVKSPTWHALICEHSAQVHVHLQHNMFSLCDAFCDAMT